MFDFRHTTPYYMLIPCAQAGVGREIGFRGFHDPRFGVIGNAADTRSRGVLPKDRTAMTRTLTGKATLINFLDQDYFPLTFPLLFPRGRVCMYAVGTVT